MRRFARSVVLLLSCMPIAVPIQAACTVSLVYPAEVQSGQTYSVLIKPAGGFYRYVLAEQWPGRRFFNQKPHSRVDTYDGTDKEQPFNTHTYSHRTTFDLQVVYRVVATNFANPTDSCYAEAIVKVHADPELDRLTRRAVIPVVGTTGGLNGSFFRTSLKLIGNDTLRGRLVFHPIFQERKDSDPSIPYDFSAGDVLVFEDLMAAFGLFGVGSLDIVPEGTNQQVPMTETRIYNQTPQGTFGTMEPMVIPAQFFGFERALEETSPGASIEVPRISEGTRVNLGVLGFEHCTFAIAITHADGTRSASVGLALQSGMLKMGTPSQLAAPFVLPDLVPGDRVMVEVFGGGIPFYTVTDNQTNDPAINFPVLADRNLGRYSD